MAGDGSDSRDAEIPTARPAKPGDSPARPPPLRISSEMLDDSDPRTGRVEFERGMSYAPALTLVLIVANIAVFGWQLASGALDSEEAIIAAGALERAALLRGDWWRLASCMFLHAGTEHLVSNCLALYILGIGCDHAFGGARFATIYLLSGLGGSLPSVAVEAGPMVGASGAIFGAMGALVVALTKVRARLYVREKRIGFVLAIWAGFQLLLGFTDPQVANFAHIGGFLGGTLAAILINPIIAPTRNHG